MKTSWRAAYAADRAAAARRERPRPPQLAPDPSSLALRRTSQLVFVGRVLG